MKRGKPLRRTGGLARDGSLNRKAGLRAKPGRNRTSPRAVAALERRSGGRCEYVSERGRRCDRRALHPHHRRTRTRAGRRDDTLANLVHLCGDCHRWVHANPRTSLERGWLLPSDH